MKRNHNYLRIESPYEYATLLLRDWRSWGFLRKTIQGARIETAWVSKRQWMGEGGFNTFNTLLLLIEKECSPVYTSPFPILLVHPTPNTMFRLEQGQRNEKFGLIKGMAPYEGYFRSSIHFLFPKSLAALYEEWSVTTQRRTTVPYWSRLHRRVNDPDPSLCGQKSA